jgi:hypothetical protein
MSDICLVHSTIFHYIINYFPKTYKRIFYDTRKYFLTTAFEIAATIITIKLGHPKHAIVLLATHLAPHAK